MARIATCPVCGAANPAPVFALGDVPVLCNQLWPDAEAARAAPSGNVTLVRCETCATIWNADFDPARMDYAPGYENALHFSAKFRAFADDLAAGLVARFGLSGRDVVEIGCGDGHMLDLMIAHGAASATGFDPSMAGKASEFAARPGVEIVPDYFRSDQLDRPFDAVLCRHVLEHLDSPMGLLHDIRRAIGGRDVPVYFEVPNAGWMLETHSLWDVIYEHVGYWTEPALVTAFRRAGFRPTRVAACYDGQFLAIEARPAEPEPDALAPGVAAIAAVADAFGAAAVNEIARLQARLGAVEGTAVIWGAGSKGITFANAMGPDAPLAALVDLNTRKHDLFAPGIALPVVAPEALTGIGPDLVVISNALYEEEIALQVRDLGIPCDFAIVSGK